MPKTTVTEEEAWSQCPCPDICRKNGMEHPCIGCRAAAGDPVAGLRLEELPDYG